MGNLPPLTRRQAEIYEFLKAEAAAEQPPPTLDQLCDALNLRSRGSLHKHIRGLVEAGLVHDSGGKQRGIRLVESAESKDAPRADAIPLPFLGKIAAGQPLEAIATQDALEVPSILRSDKPCYVLRVQGDSMIDEGILDGDLVVVESREHARNGEIVVALVDREDVTLKRIVQRPDTIELWPANATMSVMRFSPDRVQIQGVVVGQMRSYR